MVYSTVMISRALPSNWGYDYTTQNLWQGCSSKRTDLCNLESGNTILSFHSPLPILEVVQQNYQILQYQSLTELSLFPATSSIVQGPTYFLPGFRRDNTGWLANWNFPIRRNTNFISSQMDLFSLQSSLQFISWIHHEWQQQHELTRPPALWLSRLPRYVYLWHRVYDFPFAIDEQSLRLLFNDK